MNLELVRFSYAPTEVEGILIVPNLDPIYTMEQPWIADADRPSGVPFKSCIPEGDYEMRPLKRPNGQRVWVLVNESLGVYEFQTNNGADRYLCLIHPGNVVSHTQGCVLPGLKRGWLKGQRAVLKSGFRMGYAMDLMHKAIGWTQHTLTIRQVDGARYD